MHILIIGAGAIGGLLGARLALAEHDVVLVGRKSLAEAVQTNGLMLTEPGEAPRIGRVAAATSVADAMSRGPYDLAFISVKAYDTDTVSAELAAADKTPLPPLVTLQNGVGNEEALAATFGANRVVSGAIDTPVTVPAPGQIVVHRRTYRVGLAPVGQAAPAGMAAEALRSAGFTISLFQDYRRLKWTKLLMNILANASCAILNWTPAQVMAHPQTARFEARAWLEAMEVMAHLAIRPVPLGGYPFPLLLPIARRLPPAGLARVLRGFVSGGRGTKMPSLHTALFAGKPSEVSWLNGAVTRYGQQLGLPTPVNACFNGLLTALTCDEADPNEYRDRPERLAALLSPTGD